jgi:hypothetical protein
MISKHRLIKFYPCFKVNALLKDDNVFYCNLVKKIR